MKKLTARLLPITILLIAALIAALVCLRPDLASGQSRPDLASGQSRPDLASGQSRPDDNRSRALAAEPVRAAAPLKGAGIQTSNPVKTTADADIQYDDALKLYYQIGLIKGHEDLGLSASVVDMNDKLGTNQDITIPFSIGGYPVRAAYLDKRETDGTEGKILGAARTVDVTHAAALIYLTVAGHENLRTLDVSKNTALVSLNVSSCYLLQLDVSNNSMLTSLIVADNMLRSLDASNKPALTNLDCTWNNLTQLNVQNNRNLTSLICKQNMLTQLDLSGCERLIRLYCSENRFTSLDLTQNPALLDLDCSGNEMRTLDISQYKSLEWVDCSSNKMVKLKINKLPNLKTLICEGNKLASLDVSGCPHLKALFCTANRLLALDLRKNRKLLFLYCEKNKLSAIDLRNNRKLIGIYCEDNNLTAMDISRNKVLENLYCKNNRIVKWKPSLARLTERFHFNDYYGDAFQKKPIALPGKVKGVTAKSITSGQITLTWKKPAEKLSAYRIEYRAGARAPWKYMNAPAAAKKFTLKKLSKGVKYQVRLRAFKWADGSKFYGLASSYKTVRVK